MEGRAGFVISGGPEITFTLGRKDTFFGMWLTLGSYDSSARQDLYIPPLSPLPGGVEHLSLESTLCSTNNVDQ